MAAKGKKAKGPARPKTHGPKYDWVALETEFITGDEESVRAFFRLRGMARGTYANKVSGWVQKRLSLRLQAQKMLVNGWLRDVVGTLREKLKLNLNVSSGMMKVGVDALVPDNAKGYAGMKPKSALDASRMIELATRIEKNTLQTMTIIEEALKGAPLKNPDGGELGAGGNNNVVIIDMPSNGKESKEITG